MKYYSAAIFAVIISVFGYYFSKHQDADLTILFYEKFGSEPCSVLAGKVVWITGASSGIGEFLAYELAKCGCKLVLSSRRKHELERVKEKCAATSAKIYSSFDKEKDILVLPLDMIEFESHDELTRRVMHHFGQVDILVNNAGVGQMHIIEQNPFEVEKNLLDINILGGISLTKAVLPYMLKRKQGHFVAISSVVGKFGYYGLAAYTASKFALLGYFNSLRLETSSRNIKVLTVLPGTVTTSIVDNALTNVPNVTYKETPNYNPNLTGNLFSKIWMTPQRCGYLICVAMANNLREVWLSNQPQLLYIYMAQYMPNIYFWYSENYV